MNFTKTILEAVKYWVDDKFSKVEKDISNKQPIGDYALKNEIPVKSVNGMTGDVVLDTFDGSWDKLTDKPFGTEVPYCPGGDPISITDWTIRDEIYHFSSEYTTEKNFDMAKLGEKYIIKTDNYELPEKELTCCHVEWTSNNGGFFILGSSDLAVMAGYVDACDAFGDGHIAVKCTVATEDDSEIYPNLRASYGKIQMACLTLQASPTVVEILGPVTTVTIPDKFIPAQVPNMKIPFTKVGQFISVKAVDNDQQYPIEWELRDLPKIAAVADVTAAPTAEQFNALLAALRDAGYMKNANEDIDEYGEL